MASPREVYQEFKGKVGDGGLTLATCLLDKRGHLNVGQRGVMPFELGLAPER